MFLATKHMIHNDAITALHDLPVRPVIVDVTARDRGEENARIDRAGVPSNLSPASSPPPASASAAAAAAVHHFDWQLRGGL